ARAEGAAAERQEKARAEYLRDSAGAWLDQFFVAAKEEAAAPVPSTGFYRLDRALGGGLFPGLYGVGAISGAGTTSLAMQMADAVARGGGHALVFSLEMGRFDLMAKSLSRLTAEKWAAYSNRPLKKALTARQILGMYRDGGLGAEQRAEVMAAAQAYSAFSGRVVIQECLGDLGAEQIRQRVQQHCALFGATPVVFVDYLQIMAPVDVHLTDKQNMDRTVLELKRISRDFHTPVMAISSLNRLNYSRSINMEAYKESGAIEYSCDVLLGLQLQGQGNDGFDLEAAMRASPRRVELKILKNRAGMPFDSVRFDFYPQFNFFARVPGEADDE
ncbi:MAG: DNA primase, partial [Planctomycetes bacterium]|nr:DNA primase [Planctomycetota bacterium]